MISSGFRMAASCNVTGYSSQPGTYCLMQAASQGDVPGGRNARSMASEIEESRKERGPDKASGGRGNRPQVIGEKAGSGRIQENPRQNLTTCLTT